MNNPVSVEAQKKLVFIPFVNISILFIWQRNCVLIRPGLRQMLSGWLSALFCLLPFGFIQLLCAKVLPDWENICAILIAYLAPLLMGYVLIKHQERLTGNERSVSIAPWNTLKRFRKGWVIGLAAVVVLLVTASVALLVAKDLKEKHIPDQNGAENTALAVITREDILSGYSRSVAIGIGTMKSGGKTDVQGSFAELDRDNLKVSIGSMSGVRTIHATKTQSDHLELRVESQLESGNATLVITVDGAFYREVAVNTNRTITIGNPAGKLVEVRLAGESAKIEVSIYRSTH